jgi:hypothetical protein
VNQTAAGATLGQHFQERLETGTDESIPRRKIHTIKQITKKR